MTVHIAPQSEDFIRRKIESGEYQCASEVIQDSLRLLEERDWVIEKRREELRRQIDAGVRQLENGEYSTYDEHSLKAFFEQIKTEGRARLESNH